VKIISIKASNSEAPALCGGIVKKRGKLLIAVSLKLISKLVLGVAVFIDHSPSC
jgi:hypothetical protein